MVTAVGPWEHDRDDIVAIEHLVPPGIEVVEWPAQATRRAALARAGVPRLLVVPPGERVPGDVAADEDWVRTPCDPADVQARAARVLRALRFRSRDALWLDEHRVLHRGSTTTVLTASEAVVARALLARPGRVVTRSDLVRLLWPDGAPSDRAVDAIVYRLRRHGRELGLRIRVERGRGFVLDRTD